MTSTASGVAVRSGSPAAADRWTSPPDLSPSGTFLSGRYGAPTSRAGSSRCPRGTSPPRLSPRGPTTSGPSSGGAVADRIIPVDPSAGVTLPRRRRREAAMTLPSTVDVKELLDASDTAFRAFVGLCAFAGLRLGEAAGVQLGDIDLIRRTLSVSRQVQRAQGCFEIRAPKYGRSASSSWPRRSSRCSRSTWRRRTLTTTTPAAGCSPVRTMTLPCRTPCITGGGWPASALASRASGCTISGTSTRAA